MVAENSELNISQPYTFQWSVLSLIAGLLISGVFLQSYSQDARLMEIEHDKAIKACEWTLPRNRSCIAVWKASPKPLVTVLTGKGTNGKDIIITQEVK